MLIKSDLQEKIKGFKLFKEYDIGSELLYGSGTTVNVDVENMHQKIRINYDVTLIMIQVIICYQQSTILKQFKKEIFNEGRKFEFANTTNKRIVEYAEKIEFYQLKEFWEWKQVIEKEEKQSHFDFTLSADDQYLLVLDNLIISLWKYQEDSQWVRKIQIVVGRNLDLVNIRYSQPQLFSIHESYQFEQYFFKFSLYQLQNSKLKPVTMMKRNDIIFFNQIKHLSENLIIISKSGYLICYHWNIQTKKLISIQKFGNMKEKYIWFCREKKHLFILPKEETKTIQIFKRNNQNQFKYFCKLKVECKISDFIIKQNGQLLIIVQGTRLTYFGLK